LSKQNKIKLLGFPWFYSSESGLFKALRRIQIKFFSLRPFAPICAYVLAEIRRRMAIMGAVDGLIHESHYTCGSGFQQGIVEKFGSPAPQRGRSFNAARD
jgi:hypothetical protein